MPARAERLPPPPRPITTSKLPTGLLIRWLGNDLKFLRELANKRRKEGNRECVDRIRKIAEETRAERAEVVAEITKRHVH